MGCTRQCHVQGTSSGHFLPASNYLPRDQVLKPVQAGTAIAGFLRGNEYQVLWQQLQSSGTW
jgi:hypothetical protein